MELRTLLDGPVGTGRALCPPAVEPLRTYTVSTAGDAIYVARDATLGA